MTQRLARRSPPYLNLHRTYSFTVRGTLPCCAVPRKTYNRTLYVLLYLRNRSCIHSYHRILPAKWLLHCTSAQEQHHSCGTFSRRLGHACPIFDTTHFRDSSIELNLAYTSTCSYDKQKDSSSPQACLLACASEVRDFGVEGKMVVCCLGQPWP